MVIHIHNGKEEAKIPTTSTEHVPRFDLPFKVSCLCPSFHDFVVLRPDGSLLQCALVCKQASGEWMLLTVDVPCFVEGERVKLVSANLNRNYFAVTESNEVYYWQSYWDRDPNYPALVQLAEESKAADPGQT